MVNFALNSGKGVKKGEVVFLQVPESAKPLLVSLQRSVLKSGAHPIIQYLPDEMSKEFFELASEDQLKFFPATFLKGRVRQADHFLMILAETNYHELEGIDPKKIMDRNMVFKPYKEWRDKKENAGKMTWTIGLFPTFAMAKEAGLTLREAWNQVVKACYLKSSNPIKKWQNIQKKSDQIRKKLNKLEIVSVNVKSKNTDLNILIGEKRQWLGGSGRNIPSFEIFTSPDWRGTNGYIFCDQPLYRHGNIVKDIKLVFKNGVVVESSAKSGEKVLKELIKVENSDKIGEFSLTDRRFSKINKFMAETLYDENFGGEYGNTHIAIGAAYRDTYNGNIKKMSDKDFANLGFNDSAVHTDVISTENRVVTATLKSGKKIILYQDGQFQI
ncbi:Aminopeptidase PepS [bioreactor metagenome]|uniref:Aminopeptidase PepS n=1 Tax=bioreactor metagenome TaxID=1076179 RepID=A0A645C356_9ZZZZ